MKEMKYNCISDETVCIENNTVHYSAFSEQVISDQEKALHCQGVKYGHLTAVYCGQNALFHPLVMILQRIASELLFLNENSVKQVRDVLSVPYFITDTEANDASELGYDKTELKVWEHRFFLYTKSDAVPDDRTVNDADKSCLFLTSGTTGTPDIVYKKLAALKKEGQIIAERLRYTKDEKILVISPPYHAYCNAYACFAPAYCGASVTYMRNIVTKKSILKTMQKESYSVIISTPFYFDQLLDAEELQSPRLRVCSGGAVTNGMKKSAIRFNNAYGSTETGAICIEMYECGGTNEDVGSEYCDVQVSFDHSRDANAGCLSVQTEHLMFKRIHRGKAELITGNEWALNDMGFRDSFGNIVVTGRNDSIVNIGGEKVSLREVEDKISEIPNIREVKVKAETDRNNHTYLIAYIALTDPCREVDVRKELLPVLPVSKIPRKVVIKEALARTSTGKIKEEQ